VADKKTLEDALAEIEASNAKAAELKAKQAPELIAEAVERTALNARLAALPQKQRRQVLDAAGLNHVSAAPPPITPVSGRSAAQPPKPAAPLSIDWHFWCNMQTVKLWQACALTVGLDPDRLRPHPQAWMAGPGSGSVFDGKSFPSQEIEAKYEKALRLAENAVSYMNGPIFPKGTPHHGSNKEKTVLLSEVATFFISCAWPDIPDTLQTLARPSPPAMAPKATPEHQAAPLEAVPVVEVPASEPFPVTTGDIAHAFDGLRKWDEKAWKDTLGTPPKWLLACLAIRGRRGVNEHRWNPVLIGAALVNSGHAKPNSIRAKFQTAHQLMPWLDAWKTYEADNLDPV
jgi:hypothetical protein